MTNASKTGNHGDETIGQRIEQAGERFVEITRVESLGALIKDHPFAAAGIGLAIGYLAARLLHR